MNSEQLRALDHSKYVGKKRRLHIPMPDRSSYDKIGRFFPTLVPRDVLSTAALLLYQKSAKNERTKKNDLSHVKLCNSSFSGMTITRSWSGISIFIDWVDPSLSLLPV